MRAVWSALFVGLQEETAAPHLVVAGSVSAFEVVVVVVVTFEAFAKQFWSSHTVLALCCWRCWRWCRHTML